MAPKQPAKLDLSHRASDLDGGMSQGMSWLVGWFQSGSCGALVMRKDMGVSLNGGKPPISTQKLDNF